MLRAMSIPELYSFVDSKNETSKRMHAEFGFEEVQTASGFLHLGFGPGEGVLFRLRIKD